MSRTSLGMLNSETSARDRVKDGQSDHFRGHKKEQNYIQDDLTSFLNCGQLFCNCQFLTFMKVGVEFYMISELLGVQ